MGQQLIEEDPERLAEVDVAGRLVTKEVHIDAASREGLHGGPEGVGHFGEEGRVF